MYLEEYLKQFKNKKIKLFVDMDGVIVDYEFGAPGDYDIKRPLFDSIKKLEIVSKLPNVELYIFSVTRKNVGYEQKQGWLDKFAPFFDRKNRIIISREANNYTESSLLKAQAMAQMERDGSVMILIDDDPRNLNKVHELNEDVYLLKDTVLVD